MRIRAVYISEAEHHLLCCTDELLIFCTKDLK
jgi:hypothetical protein